MFQSRWRLFRAWGMPINVDPSWFIVLVLLTWTLARQFRILDPTLPSGTYWLMGLATTLAFFACIVLHELGHAVVARRSGIPLRGITLFLFGGVAELEGEPGSAAKEFRMAIAGPIVTAVLALLFLVIDELGLRAGWPFAVLTPLDYLVAINVAVLVFNLVPAFPLDGGRVLRAALWGLWGDVRRATFWASRAGQLFAWVLIALGVVDFFNADAIGGLWLVLIGLFLHGAATQSYRAMVTRQLLQGEPVRRFMNPAPVTVAPDLGLRRWVEEYVYRYHYKSYPVVVEDHLVGMVGTRALSEMPREEWDRHTVEEIMRHDIEQISLTPDTDAFDALQMMQRTGLTRLLVVDERSRLVGIVALRDMLRFLQLKLELEGDGAGGARGPQAEARPPTAHTSRLPDIHEQRSER